MNESEPVQQEVRNHLPNRQPKGISKVVSLVMTFGFIFLLAGTPTHGKINVVATTGMIADAVQAVGGSKVDVTALMGPGVDPHLYRATQGDVRALAAADMIFYNGLTLEGRMVDIFARMSRLKPTVAVADAVPVEFLLEAEDYPSEYDPHVWFDAELWRYAVLRIEEALAENDPENANLYRANAEVYLAKLDELHSYALRRIQEIPEEQRVLVTAHDAFGYFGRAYGIEVVGLQGISTDTEIGLRDVQDLVEMVVERGIPAIFIETSVPTRSIEAVVEGARRRGQDVSIGGELFSDALGARDTPAGTFFGMFQHNVDTIVNALAQ